ncbi:MAG: prepilin-type N-terminal cleavage/methylation domain-containing protein [Elusimicrobiales bacterium]|nr:prepilin-type N-terminal cleavage/methylation domain-containing protein [Elusimicrobiales bacterium]
MKKTNASANRGFTLIELMIVVAIIGILAAVAIPKFADLINKSKEGATKGSLGSIRSALTVYYGDQEGAYPQDTLASLMPKYLQDIPMAKIPPNHPDNSTVTAANSASYNAGSDAGGWAYNNVSGEVAGGYSWGSVVVSCTHTDSKGVRWSSQI